MVTSLEAIAGDDIVGWLALPLLDQWRGLRPGDVVLFQVGPDVELDLCRRRRQCRWFTVDWWHSAPDAEGRLVLRVDGVPLLELVQVRGFRPNIAAPVWGLK